MTNTEIYKLNLNDIDLQLIKNAIFLCYRDHITSRAPLGFAGDTILLFGSETPKRKSVVSIRNYSGYAELLITDSKGNFLFYGRYDINLGVEFIAEQYYNIFCLVKDKIELELENIPQFQDIDNHDRCTLSIGFEMIKAYQRRFL